jgi:hypothetical protein
MMEAPAATARAWTASAGFHAVDFIRGFEAAAVFVVPGGAEHDHASIEAEFSVADAPVRPLVDGVALEAEYGTEPVDGGGGIAVAQGGDDGGFGVCRHLETPLQRKSYTMIMRRGGEGHLGKIGNG